MGIVKAAALAANDMLWRTGQFTANVVQVNEQAILGTGGSGARFQGA